MVRRSTFLACIELFWALKRLNWADFYLLVWFDARQNEEYSRASGTAGEQPTQAENDGSFVLLDDLKTDEERERQRDEDQEPRKAGQHDSAGPDAFRLGNAGCGRI